MVILALGRLRLYPYYHLRRHLLLQRLRRHRRHRQAHHLLRPHHFFAFLLSYHTRPYFQRQLRGVGQFGRASILMTTGHQRRERVGDDTVRFHAWAHGS